MLLQLIVNFYLSASSSTNISIFLIVKLGEFCIWSINLPGVAMTISGDNLNAASCALKSKPPINLIIQIIRVKIMIIYNVTRLYSKGLNF